jgi:hypothetical protein
MAKSRIQIGKTVKVGNKDFIIGRSTRQNKKYKACPKDGAGACIHFGAKGYHARPNTNKGDNYCARSSGIKSDKISANTFARMLWNCNGKKSMKK